MIFLHKLILIATLELIAIHEQVSFCKKVIMFPFRVVPLVVPAILDPKD